MKDNLIILATIVLLTLLLTSCKSKSQDFNGLRLPAYQSNNDTEIIKSIYQSSNIRTNYKLKVDNKIYPINDLPLIMDTIDDGYKISFERDTVTNINILNIISARSK